VQTHVRKLHVENHIFAEQSFNSLEAAIKKDDTDKIHGGGMRSTGPNTQQNFRQQQYKKNNLPEDSNILDVSYIIPSA
jgi:hypothetical protein